MTPGRAAPLRERMQARYTASAPNRPTVAPIMASSSEHSPHSLPLSTPFVPRPMPTCPRAPQPSTHTHVQPTGATRNDGLQIKGLYPRVAKWGVQLQKLLQRAHRELRGVRLDYFTLPGGCLAVPLRACVLVSRLRGVPMQHFTLLPRGCMAALHGPV